MKEPKKWHGTTKKRKQKGVLKNKKNGGENIKNDDFLKNLITYIQPNQTVIIGVSGGPDSMYLLTRCIQAQKTLPFRIIVGHINHGLRGKNSKGDEKFVKDFCKRYGIKCESTQLKLLDKKNNTSQNLEELGRDARYNFLEKLRKKHRAVWTLVAHHLNDNIETMLFNLIRGAHMSGIKAMEIVLQARHILRPMLGITKEEILSFLSNNRIEFRLDESNNNTDFSRNWLRKKIIPLFHKINPNFEQTFKETLHNFAQTSHYLEQQCEDWLKKNSQNLHIDLDKFLHEHSSFQKQLLVHLYKQHHGSSKKLTNNHLQEILAMIKQRQANKKKEFGPKTFLEIIRQKNGKNTGKHLIRLKTF